jgi:hypothetical protein
LSVPSIVSRNYLAFASARPSPRDCERARVQAWLDEHVVCRDDDNESCAGSQSEPWNESIAQMFVFDELALIQ